MFRVDPRETVLPALGVITLEDAETGEIVSLDTSSAAVRKTYADINAKRLSDFRRALARSNIDLLEVETDKPFITPLRKFFERRAKRQ